ncbi:protein still life, isoform SIF type 1-like isoform X2 [Anneissia japonica]|uniref:protein still life, isoform SIF type 1-like isoform X2 n=1 Tax=Anneissia japonica TaxID=1529436 RepID=UPI001425B267|nr:protein still life, isoform SIF type 1-like isoform X2 [Anneissia japonica]
MFNKLKGLRDSVSRKGIVRRISQRKIKNRRNKHADFEIDDNDLLLAEAYTLVLEDSEQRWEKLSENLLDVVVNCVSNGVPTCYRVIASEMDHVWMDVSVSIPGTQIEKKSDCFVQWRDISVGGAWGLNFVSPEEAEHFLTLCKPTGDIDFSKLDLSGNISSSSQASNSGLYSPDCSIPVTNVDDLLKQDNSFASDESPEKRERTKSHSISPNAPQGIKAKLLRKRSNTSKSKYRNSFGTSPNVSTVTESQESAYDNIVNKSPRSVGSPLNKNLVPGNKYLAVQSEPSINKQFDSQDIDTIHEDAAYTPPRVVVSTELLDRTGRDTQQQSASYDQLETFRSRAMTDTSLPRNSPNVVKRRIKSPRLGNSRPISTDVDSQIDMEPTTEILEAYQMHLQSSTEYADSGFSGTETITTSSSGIFHGLPHLNGGGSDSGSSMSNGDRGSFANSKDGKSSMPDDFSKILSDDDEEEEDEGEGDSHSMGSQQTKASCSRQRGATRKAGWLSVRSLLVCRKKKVEKASKKRWKDYWVCLKGTLLLFFVCDEKNAPDENSEPRHIIVVEGGIAQAVPEHPKKDNIFCLSTAFGDSYLLQAPTQIELENWITAIHSACSSAFARQHGKDDTLKLLRNYFQKLEEQISNETKMKKMAELQLSVVKDPKNKDAIKNQVLQWGYNLEKFHLESYRLRCYQASLQGSELPNPKTLLACVSKPTKTSLSKLGYFSVSSFHSMVSARAPIGMQGHFSKPKSKNWFGTLRRGDSAKNRPTILSPAGGDDNQTTESNTQENEDEHENIMNGSHHQDEHEELPRCESSLSDINCDGMTIKIKLPDNHSVMATIKPGMTVQDLLVSSCSQRQMDYHNFYVRFKQSMKFGFNYEIPEKSVVVELGKFDEIDICAKSIHQVELYMFNDEMKFGFSVEAELGDNEEQEDQLCVFISDVEKDCLAYHHDLQVGDELLVINGKVVCDLDMIYIENLIANEATLTLTVRSCRTIFPQTNAMEETNKIIDQLTCPPPPSQSRLTDDMLHDLVIPAPNVFGDDGEGDYDELPSETSLNSTSKSLKYMYDPNEEEEMNKENKAKDKGEIEQLLKDAEQLTELCRTVPSRHNSVADSMSNGTDEDQRVAASRLRKVIMELIDTERGYLKDLNVLVGRYLEPLQTESFLSADEIDSLFGNVKEIIKFQKTFLGCLEDSLEVESGFTNLTDPTAFKPVLVSIGDSFLLYMDYFKLYSSFCASHSKAQKILQPASDNAPLMAFLDARNPKHQHSASLASYLIKPIQRVLKYPLLIMEMRSSIEKESEEYKNLSKALKGMERVAEHINEMMRVHEEFGEVFDSLVSEQYHVLKEVPDLAMDDLLMYSNARWLNCQDDIGKVKKGKEPEVIIFVFRPAIVIIYKEKNKRRSKYPTNATGTLKGNPSDEVIRFKWMIPVAYLQVRESTVNDTEYLSLWELVHVKSAGSPEKLFQFSCCTLAKKTSFVKSLRSIIKEHNRAKALPGGRYNSLKKKKAYQPMFGKRITPKRKTKTEDLTDSPSMKELNETSSQASDKSSDGSSQINSLRSDDGIDYEKILENELELGRYNEQGIHALPLNFNSNNNIMHTSHMNNAQPFFLSPSPRRSKAAKHAEDVCIDDATREVEELIRELENVTIDRKVKQSDTQYNTFPTKRSVNRVHSDEMDQVDKNTVASLNSGLDALCLDTNLNGLTGLLLDVPLVSKSLSGSSYDNLCHSEDDSVERNQMLQNKQMHRRGMVFYSEDNQ